MKISIIVPTYNRASLIAETIDSILAQSLQPAEVIVVDDGSIDNTENILAPFGNAIKYIYTTNSGVCHARNVGVDTSTSPWIAFCDSDDLWAPEKLARQ